MGETDKNNNLKTEMKPLTMKQWRMWRMMKAAPALYNALKEITEDYADAREEWSDDIYERTAPILENAREALAKVEGK